MFIIALNIVLILIFDGNLNVKANESNLDYNNPCKIVITIPENGCNTTASNISILGSCDFRYPIYMNGEEITTTDHGFFTIYVPLEIGENIFLFQNNDH